MLTPFCIVISSPTTDYNSYDRHLPKLFVTFAHLPKLFVIFAITFTVTTPKLPGYVLSLMDQVKLCWVLFFQFFDTIDRN